MSKLYYGDLSIGEERTLGPWPVTESDIVSFATDYDPLPFHTDPVAAAETPHNGLIASGLQTVCIANRLVVDGFRRDLAVIAGLEIEHMTWSKPVRPGAVLTVESKILDKRLSESNPDNGIVRHEIRVFDQDDAEVLSYVEAMLVER
jgi:acyl dehydratase